MRIVEESEQQCIATAVSTAVTSTDNDSMQKDCKINKERVNKLTADMNALQQKLSVMSSV